MNAPTPTIRTGCKVSSRVNIRAKSSPEGNVALVCKKHVFDNKVAIGKGANSNVYKWFDTDRNRYVALKEIIGKTEDDDKVQHEMAMNEYMKHSKRFPTYHGCFCEQEKVFLMNDFIAPGETLFQIRQSDRNVVRTETAKQFFQDMCDFVTDCHSLGIIHRDIKLDNFVYSSTEQATYGIDLGLSKRIHEPIADKTIQKATCLYEKQNIGRMGTLMYMSPEMLVKGPYTAKTDIWSLGVCFYELLYGKNPFMQKKEWQFTNQEVVSHTSLNKAFTRSMKGPVFSSDISDEMNDLLRAMLNPIDSERPTIFQLKEFVDRLCNP